MIRGDILHVCKVYKLCKPRIFSAFLHRQPMRLLEGF